jgi:hypothetical protein
MDIDGLEEVLRRLNREIRCTRAIAGTSPLASEILNARRTRF